MPEGTAISGGSIWFDQVPCGGGAMGLVNNGVIRSSVTDRQVSINVAVAGSGRLECAEADIGGEDASAGADGCVNNGDFQLFFGLFFAGCN